MATIRHKRGTRAALAALAGSSSLLPGQLYVLTDESRLAAAMTVNSYETFAKESEASGLNPTLRAIMNGGASNFNNNPRTKPVLSSPPTITVGTGTVPAGYTQEFVFGAANAPFTSGGGKPTTVSGVTTFPCVTADATFNGIYWRVSTEVFGDGVSFLLDSITATGYRFLVDGQYVSLTGTTSSAGSQRWYTLEFASYGKRVVTVEGLLDTAFSRAAVKANGTLMMPKQGSPGVRIINMGDSNAAMNGEDRKYDCYSAVVADHLGIADVWASGVTDTGFVATLSGTYNNYSERRSDWVGNSPDALIFTASLNEIVQGTSVASHKAAVAAELVYIRSVLGSAVPVFIFGIITNSDYLTANSILALSQSHETAVGEAVSEFNDPLVKFIPSITGGIAFLTGSGPGQGNWDLFVNGTNHANVAGNALAGRWIANALIGAAASMAGVQVPAFVQAEISSLESTGIAVLKDSNPATPAADTVVIFGRKIAGRMLPAYKGPSGLDSALQPFLARNKVGYWCPPGNATTVPGVLGFTAPTVTGFTATARNVATTNKFTRMRRLGYVTAATAAAVGNWRVGVYQYTTGGASELGGFNYIVRFGISDASAVAGARMFMGVRSSSTPANAEPNTLTNCIGIGHGASDTNMMLFYGGSSAQTPIDLGAGFPIDRNTTPYELALFSPPGETTVFWDVTNLATGAVQSGQITGGATVLPQESLLIAPWGFRTNNATALAVGLDVMSAYIETDY